MQKEKTGILQQIVRTVEYNWKSKFNNKDPKTGKFKKQTVKGFFFSKKWM